MASVRASLRPSATAVARPICITARVWLNRVTKWSPSGWMKTWVLCLRRRKALECSTRSRSSSKAVRYRSGSSSCSRPRDSAERVAAGASISRSSRSRSSLFLSNMSMISTDGMAAGVAFAARLGELE